MNKRKKFFSAAAAAALGLAGLIGAAAPAHAATTTPSELWFVATAQSAPLTGCNIANNQQLESPLGTALPNSGPPAVTGTTGDQVRIYNQCPNAVRVNWGQGGTLPTLAGNTDALFTLTGSVSRITIETDSGSQLALVEVQAPSPAPPTPTPTSVSTPETQTFELSLTPTDGTTCTNSSESGRAGTWMTLPGANDCTPPATQANANLLGWATILNFPVAIAQRQVNNGWGAYEIFNDEGQLTAVFIPAGGATFLSGSGQLYPIWSE